VSADFEDDLEAERLDIQAGRDALALFLKLQEPGERERFDRLFADQDSAPEPEPEPIATENDLTPDDCYTLARLGSA
jgi:hypothetical protein